MRVWIPATPADIATLVEMGSIVIDTGFAVTDQWAALIGETDDEVLEDLRALNVEAQIVIVADVDATVINAESGEVAISGPVSSRRISAFLAHSEPEDEEFSWFGPTEGLNLLDFLG